MPEMTIGIRWYMIVVNMNSSVHLLEILFIFKSHCMFDLEFHVLYITVFCCCSRHQLFFWKRAPTPHKESRNWSVTSMLVRPLLMLYEQRLVHVVWTSLSWMTEVPVKDETVYVVLLCWHGSLFSCCHWPERFWLSFWGSMWSDVNLGFIKMFLFLLKQAAVFEEKLMLKIGIDVCCMP